MFISP